MVAAERGSLRLASDELWTWDGAVMPKSCWRPLTTTLASDLDACHDEGEFVSVV
jgi:hypothetical protein